MKFDTVYNLFIILSCSQKTLIYIKTNIYFIYMKPYLILKLQKGIVYEFFTCLYGYVVIIIIVLS